VAAVRKLALFALVTAIFAYGFYTFLRVQPSADIDTHISYAEQIHGVRDLVSPHFLFQLALKVFHAAGSTYANAAVWVLGLCYGGMAVLIAREMERRGLALTRVHCFVLIPCVLIACHIFLPTILKPNLYYGYLTPISWHNPTQQPNKLFTLWIYFLYCSEFLDSPRARMSRVVSMGGLSILSALAKPSFLVAFLPTAGLFACADLVRRRWRQVVLFAAGIALPAALVLLWQARVAYGTQAAPSVVFVPFVVWNFEETLYKLPASLAFPIVVGTIAWREGRHDPKIQFTVVFTAIALFVTFCLGEGGPRLMEGNFAWTGQTAVFLAYVEALLFLLSHPGAGRTRQLAWVVFGVHVLCGVIWYGVNFSDARVPSL
jgi:hypothetical protein